MGRNDSELSKKIGMMVQNQEKDILGESNTFGCLHLAKEKKKKGKQQPGYGVKKTGIINISC